MLNGDISNRGNHIVAVDMMLLLYSHSNLAAAQTGNLLQRFANLFKQAPTTFSVEYRLDERMASVVNELGEFLNVVLVSDIPPTPAQEQALENAWFSSIVVIEDLFQFRTWMQTNNVHAAISNLPRQWGAADLRVQSYQDKGHAMQIITRLYGPAMKATRR
jgi:hypothetical protein